MLVNLIKQIKVQFFFLMSFKEMSWKEKKNDQSVSIIIKVLY